MFYFGGYGESAQAAYPQCTLNRCQVQADCAELCYPFTYCTYACSNISYRYNPPDPGEYWGCCSFTIEEGFSICTSWTSWSACIGGYETRTCTDPNNYELEIRACTSSGGPGGSPAPTPTPPPGCIATNPAAPSLSTPTNGSTTSTLSPTLSWSISSWGTGCPQDNHFLVFVDTVNPPVTQVYTTPSGATTSYVFTGTAGTTYYWRIQAVNGSRVSTSGVYSFTLPGEIAGIVYNDVDAVCGGSPSTFAGMTVSYDPDPVGAPIFTSSVSTSDGSFSIVGAPNGFGTLSLLNYPAGYSCSPCSNGCIQGSITNPSSTSRFYLTAARNAWWQVAGAGIYAGQGGYQCTSSQVQTIRTANVQTRSFHIVNGSSNPLRSPVMRLIALGGIF